MSLLTYVTVLSLRKTKDSPPTTLNMVSLLDRSLVLIRYAYVLLTTTYIMRYTYKIKSAINLHKQSYSQLVQTIMLYQIQRVLQLISVFGEKVGILSGLQIRIKSVQNFDLQRQLHFYGEG